MQGLVQAGDDGFNGKFRLEGKGGRQNVACANFDLLNEQIMFQHDETSINLGCIVQDVLPVEDDF